MTMLCLPFRWILLVFLLNLVYLASCKKFKAGNVKVTVDTVRRICTFVYEDPSTARYGHLKHAHLKGLFHGHHKHQRLHKIKYLKSNRIDDEEEESGPLVVHLCHDFNSFHQLKLDQKKYMGSGASAYLRPLYDNLQPMIDSIMSSLLNLNKTRDTSDIKWKMDLLVRKVSKTLQGLNLANAKSQNYYSETTKNLIPKGERRHLPASEIVSRTNNALRILKRLSKINKCLSLLQRLVEPGPEVLEVVEERGSSEEHHEHEIVEDASDEDVSDMTNKMSADLKHEYNHQYEHQSHAYQHDFDDNGYKHTQYSKSSSSSNYSESENISHTLRHLQGLTEAMKAYVRNAAPGMSLYKTVNFIGEPAEIEVDPLKEDIMNDLASLNHEMSSRSYHRQYSIHHSYNIRSTLEELNEAVLAMYGAQSLAGANIEADKHHYNDISNDIQHTLHQLPDSDHEDSPEAESGESEEHDEPPTNSIGTSQESTQPPASDTYYRLGNQFEPSSQKLSINKQSSRSHASDHFSLNAHHSRDPSPININKQSSRSQASDHFSLNAHQPSDPSPLSINKQSSRSQASDHFSLNAHHSSDPSSLSMSNLNGQRNHLSYSKKSHQSHASDHFSMSKNNGFPTGFDDHFGKSPQKSSFSKQYSSSKNFKKESLHAMGPNKKYKKESSHSMGFDSHFVKTPQKSSFSQQSHASEHFSMNGQHNMGSSLGSIGLGPQYNPSRKQISINKQSSQSHASDQFSLNGQQPMNAGSPLSSIGFGNEYQPSSHQLSISKQNSQSHASDHFSANGAHSIDGSSLGSLGMANVFEQSPQTTSISKQSSQSHASDHFSLNGQHPLDGSNLGIVKQNSQSHASDHFSVNGQHPMDGSNLGINKQSSQSHASEHFSLNGQHSMDASPLSINKQSSQSHASDQFSLNGQHSMDASPLSSIGSSGQYDPSHQISINKQSSQSHASDHLSVNGNHPAVSAALGSLGPDLQQASDPFSRKK